MKWVSFHSHSTFSYGDGFGTVQQHVRRVADLGMTALALSEHGNVNSHAALERECRAAGIKPIFGVEAYFGPVGEKRTQRKYHITLFAKDQEGYHNLNKLVTQSYLDSHYYPTVSPENLRKHAKGLVGFSGCSDSFISCVLLGGKLLGDKRLAYTDEQYASAKKKIDWFMDVFDGDFYLETQRFSRLERTCVLNPAFAKLSEDTGARLIATADVHYPFPHQNKMQSMLHAARRSSTVAATEAAWEYDILLTYPESDRQMYNDLQDTGLTKRQSLDALLNTTRLAAQCNVELPKAKPLRFPCDDPARELTRQVAKGWKRRCAQRPDMTDHKSAYEDRVKQELKVIRDKDFCDYFLVVADLVQWAKDNDITVGPGRGSAAGSLLCYLLGITEIDPLHPTFDKMVFERFIDPNRADMPDIDLDFDDSLRKKIAERAREVYGNENVANVANHVKYRGRKALQDVARAYGLSPRIFDPIAQKCAIRVETDDRVDDSIADTLESFSSDVAIASLVDNYENIIKQAVQLEGNQHSMGIHAGGFVIASDPIPQVCAIYTKEKGTGRHREIAQVIPYEKRDAEYLGMLKMDFLGLTTCGMLGLARQWSGVSLDKLYSMFYETGKENDEILARFRTDDVAGIFQYEGGTTRQVVRDVLPTNFDELAACGALSRPGPFYGGQTRNYIAVKNGEKDWERIHPGFDKHVEWTYGQIVYQEQIMWILRDLAGFSVERVLKVRKIIGKKLGEFQFAELWAEFRDGCAANGVGEDAAAKVWGGITTAAGYAFNTAHAYSYALIAWWQMWFKIHYPSIFFAATLAKNGDGKDDLARRTMLLQDAITHGVTILPIDPNQSEMTWKPVHGKHALRPGFSQISGVGEATAADIVAWRYDEGRSTWIGWDDLSAVKGVGAKTVVSMREFAQADDPFGIQKTEKQLDAFRKQCANGAFDGYGLPSIEEFSVSSGMPENSSGVAFVGLVANVVFRDEIESIRNRTGQSVEDIRASLDRPESTKKATVFAYDEFGEVALRVSRWRYDSLEDKLSAIKKDHHIVVGYGRTFEGKSGSLQLTELWILEPD
jgi:DNA polymerase-3 subunit alpha